MSLRLEKLRQISRIHEQDAYYTVFHRAEIYPTLVKVYQPRNPYGKLIDTTLERQYPRKGQTGGKEMHHFNDETPLERSVRRSKKVITRIVLANQFDLWALFTTDPEKVEINNDELVKSKFKNWLDYERKKQRFEYLIVPERHKDGALHFHALFQSFGGGLYEVESKGRKIKDKTGKQVLRFQDYNLGSNSAVYFPPEDILKVSLYVKKYISKEFAQANNKKRYWASKGLVKPAIEENGAWFDEKAEELAQSQYGFKQGTIFDFTKTTVLSLKQQRSGIQ